MRNDLNHMFPPSAPCSCDVCKSYCIRPGWWTVEEAENAIHSGYAWRMMVEISPEKTFGVLSPAFKGNEGNYALQLFAKNGCTFFIDGLCELFTTKNQPLECRFCHHERKGEGKKCHLALEKDWNTAKGKRLIVHWGNIIGFWEKQGIRMELK